VLEYKYWRDTMELWDCYDKNRNKLNKTLTRGRVQEIGEYHIVVGAYIMSNDKRFLVTKRSASKRHYPSYFEVPGGSVLQGETSLEGMIREIEEETGIVIKSEGIILTSTRRDFNQSFQDIYLFIQDIDLKDIILQDGETSEAKLLTYQEIEDLFLKNKFVGTVFTTEIQNALKKHLT